MSITSVSQATAWAASTDALERCEAIEYFRDHPDGQHLPLLVEALKDDASFVVATALEWAVEERAASVVGALLPDLVASDDRLVASYALWAIGQLGLRSLLPLVTEVAREHGSADAGRRVAAAEAAYCLTGQRHFAESVFRGLTDEDPEVRAFAARSISVIVAGASALRAEALERLDTAAKVEPFPAIRECITDAVEDVRAHGASSD